MHGKLHSHFETFVRKIQGSEFIDELELTPQQRQAKRADVFFNGRRVIGEIKLLATDTEPKIEAILEPYTRTEYWPLFVERRPISTIVPHLPNAEQIHQQIYDAVAGSLE